MGSTSNVAAAGALFLIAWALTADSAVAWDSSKLNPTHPTHEYLTDFGINQAGVAEFRQYRKELLEGSNQELHELKVRGNLHGIDLDDWRIRHRGTNAGTDDIKGVWRETLAAYRSGNKRQAYFLLGVILHYVEDMGVPAHANGVYHQGSMTEFDNFEAMALANWKPDFNSVNRTDPRYANPADYYAFSRNWTRADAPDYDDPDTFSKTWITASRAERILLAGRQARTAMAVKWTLQSAARAFGAK